MWKVRPCTIHGRHPTEPAGPETPRAMELVCPMRNKVCMYVSMAIQTLKVVLVIISRVRITVCLQNAKSTGARGRALLVPVLRTWGRRLGETCLNLSDIRVDPELHLLPTWVLRTSCGAASLPATGCVQSYHAPTYVHGNPANEMSYVLLSLSVSGYYTRIWYDHRAYAGT